MCHCGNTGCLETLCSISSLIDDIMADIKKSERFSDYGSSRLKTEDLYRLYEQDKDIITRNVEKNAEYLGIGISNTIKMFNPELIIIHGEIIKFGDKYLSKVKESVSKNTFPKVKDNYNIQFSKLGENVGLIGATSIVFDNIFDLDSSNIAGQYIIKKIIN
jgi:predicted NBD/HSP70 family sugar kinase